MTLIHRAGPGDDFFTPRRTMECLFDGGSRPRAPLATFAGAEHLVGPGSGR